MRSTADLPLIDLAYLHQRCTEVDGCLLWKLKTNHGPHATIGRQGYQVRRLVWAAMGKNPVGRGYMVAARCGHALCVSPNCMMKQKRNGHVLGTKLTLLHRKRIADANRAVRGNINMQIAREIRASDEPLSVVAARAGTSISNAHRVRRGVAWVDYESPFVQLAMRA